MKTIAVWFIIAGVIFLGGCYDPNEGMPTICYKLSNKIIQVGDTLILEDCSECQSIFVNWGDKSVSFYDYYDYKTKRWNLIRNNYVFRQQYQEPGEYELTITVSNTIDPPPSFDPSGGGRHVQRSEKITVR